MEKLDQAEDFLHKCQQILDDPRLDPKLLISERFLHW